MLPPDALRACLQSLHDDRDSVDLTAAVKRALASLVPGPAVAACLLQTLEGTAADALMEAFLELLGSCCEHTSYVAALAAALEWSVLHGSPRDLLLHCMAAVDLLTLDGGDLMPPQHTLLQHLVRAAARLLPKLPRRRTATMMDCLPALLLAAEVQGRQLQTLYVCSQQQQQQQQQPSSTASRCDEAGLQAAGPAGSLVLGWQPYVGLAAAAAQVVAQEADPQVKQQAGEQVASGVCQLLLWLTACWQPPGWPLTWQSLALPPAVAGGMARVGHTTLDSGGARDAASAAVQQLVEVISSCGVDSWEDLQQVATDGAVAAVTATYTLQPMFAGTLSPRVPSSTMVRLCCSWAQQLAEWASDVDWGEQEGAMRVALLWKAGMLLWSSGRAAAAAEGDGGNGGLCVGDVHGGEDAAADEGPTPELLQQLQSAVSMFSFTMVQVPVPSVRRLLHLAVQQLLRGLRPRLRLQCLQALLAAAHPEEAALLLQCVQQLVEGLMQAPEPSRPGSASGGRSTLASALDLCVCMLQQTGPCGWQTPDQLPDVANALAAAVAVVDFALLRSQRSSAPGAALDTTATAAGVHASLDDLRQQLQLVLPPLTRAAQDALQQLAARGHDGGTSGRGEELGAPVGSTAEEEGGMDALLALQRLQLSLEHVQQSLGG